MNTIRKLLGVSVVAVALSGCLVRPPGVPRPVVPPRGGDELTCWLPEGCAPVEVPFDAPQAPDDRPARVVPCTVITYLKDLPDFRYCWPMP